MKTTETNMLDWLKRYGTEEACAQALANNAGRKSSVVRDTGMIMAQVKLETV